jgi:hypothetical protein
MSQSNAMQFDQLVGNTVLYRGLRYQIVDYLINDQSLILRALDAEASIQVNQFGNATRRVQPTLAVSIFSSNDYIQPEIIEWLEHI